MAKRASTRGIKSNRHYTYEDAALKLGVSVQTVRDWSRQGLDVMTDARPHLILGQDLIAFIDRRQVPRTTMPPDQFYCFRCKSHTRPLDGIVFFTPYTASSGRLEGFCGECEGPCGRFIGRRGLAEIEYLLEIVWNDSEQA